MEEAFLPSRLVLSETSFQKVIDMIDNPPSPTKAMLELMNGHSDSPFDFFSMAGLWEGREVSLTSIRQKAWPNIMRSL